MHFLLIVDLRLKRSFLERYPGDEYVDVVGMDNYWDFRPDGGDTSLVVLKSRILTKYAKEHNKLSAFTETGTQTRDSLWYSQLLNILYLEGVELNYLCTWSGLLLIRTSCCIGFLSV